MASDEQTGKTSGADAGGCQPAVVLREPTRARLLWISIVVVVLGLLWLETRHEGTGSHNLFLNADSNAVGAEVLIDGGSRGLMTSSGSGGLGGAVFYGHIGDGRHAIEVRKQGYRPFLKEIEMRREDYVKVELSP